MRTQKQVQKVVPVRHETQFEEMPLDYSTRAELFLKLKMAATNSVAICIIPCSRSVRSRPLEQSSNGSRAAGGRGYKSCFNRYSSRFVRSDFSPIIDLTAVLKLLEDIPGLERDSSKLLEPTEIIRAAGKNGFQL